MTNYRKYDPSILSPLLLQRLKGAKEAFERLSSSRQGLENWMWRGHSVQTLSSENHSSVNWYQGLSHISHWSTLNHPMVIDDSFKGMFILKLYFEWHLLPHFFSRTWRKLFLPSLSSAQIGVFSLWTRLCTNRISLPKRNQYFYTWKPNETIPIHKWTWFFQMDVLQHQNRGWTGSLKAIGLFPFSF